MQGTSGRKTIGEPYMGSPFGNPGTVSISNMYGPVTTTNAEQGSIGTPKRVTNITPMSGASSAGSLLTIPVMLAIGIIAWYAIKTYG